MYAKILTPTQALLLSFVSLLLVPIVATAGPPVHEVRGHGIYNLDPPTTIDQITINATVDENGVVKGSVVVWPSVYLALPDQQVPDFAGWTWVIRINSLNVTGNVATIEGMIVFDNRFPTETVGCPVGFVVRDNGSGASDPPDELELHGLCAGGDTKPIRGGNFTVK